MVCSERLISNDEISSPSGLLLCNALFSDERSLDRGLLPPRALIQLSINDEPSVGDTLVGLPLSACTVCSVRADALF